MTIVIATSWDGRAAIASDSAGTDGWGSQACHGSKVKKYAFGFVGFSGSYAMLPWLDQAFKETDFVETECQAWALAKRCRQLLRDDGWKNEGGKELPKLADLSILILSNRGKIWTLQSDFAILKWRQYAAIGSGSLNALGAAAALRFANYPACSAATQSVRIAIEQISSCGGRVHSRKIDY